MSWTSPGSVKNWSLTQTTNQVSHPVRLFTPFQETNFNRVPVRVRLQPHIGSGVLIASEHDDARQTESGLGMDQSLEGSARSHV